MEIKIILEPGAIMPTKSTPGAAAYDVYLPHCITVDPGRDVYSLGLRVEIPDGYEIMIEPRSGFSSKGMLGVKKGAYAGDNLSRFDADVIPGKIDSDYRGIVGVIISNRGVAFNMRAGTRIAQMTVRKVENVDFVQVESLSETKRGTGGFGSTGVCEI